MSFAVGSLVSARGREWVVLPESERRPARPAPARRHRRRDHRHSTCRSSRSSRRRSHLPDPTTPGDYRSCRLLRDALRLGFRSSAGPFRSFGRIAVEPRPYQLVPLLMALKLDPVRLLIADDVGIGKTIEAAPDRPRAARPGRGPSGSPCSARRTSPSSGSASCATSSTSTPSSSSPSTAQPARARPAASDESLFDRYPYVIVSTDFIKSDRRRDEFLRACPELVIVDEAHTCA